MKRLWVVEMKMDSGKYEPTVGCGLTREDGRRELRAWKENCAREMRLVPYGPAQKAAR